jgi:hypothetical protein
VSRPKLEERRQTLLYLGSDCRKVVRRRALDTIEVKASVFIAEAVIGGVNRQAQESNDLRVLVSRVGCRVRGEASSKRNQGEPRGEPRRREVGRRGGSPKTRRAGSCGPIRVLGS